VLRIALILTLAAVAAADSATAATVDRSPYLWATVNVCDTQKSPDTLGVRASMPGSGRKGETMYMRFRAQFYSRVDNRWHNFVAPGTDSGFVSVGSARYKSRQSGWSFEFSPKPGETFSLRGIVGFEWRQGKKVVRRATKRTTTGQETTVGDPPGYSKATCDISAPAA
jgi:hypothetical protein